MLAGLELEFSPITWSVILGKSLKFSDPRFPHMQNEVNALFVEKSSQRFSEKIFGFSDPVFYHCLPCLLFGIPDVFQAGFCLGAIVLSVPSALDALASVSHVFFFVTWLR